MGNLPFATRCMNLEDITLSEISQTQKDKRRVTPLGWKVGQCVEADIGALVAWARERGARGGDRSLWVRVISTQGVLFPDGCPQHSAHN